LPCGAVTHFGKKPALPEKKAATEKGLSAMVRALLDLKRYGWAIAIAAGAFFSPLNAQVPVVFVKPIDRMCPYAALSTPKDAFQAVALDSGPNRTALIPGSSRYEGSFTELESDWPIGFLRDRRDEVGKFFSATTSPLFTSWTKSFANEKEAGIALKEQEAILNGARFSRSRKKRPPYFEILLNRGSAFRSEWQQGEPIWEEIGGVEKNAHTLLGRFVTILDSPQPDSNKFLVNRSTGVVEEVIVTPKGSSLRLEELGLNPQSPDSLRVVRTHTVPLRSDSTQSIFSLAITYESPGANQLWRVISEKELRKWVEEKTDFLQSYFNRSKKMFQVPFPENPKSPEQIIGKQVDAIVTQPSTLSGVRLSGQVLNVEQVSTSPALYNIAVLTKSDVFENGSSRIIRAQNCALDLSLIWIRPD
jgi:hypothetical protein